MISTYDELIEMLMEEFKKSDRPAGENEVSSFPLAIEGNSCV